MERWEAELGMHPRTLNLAAFFGEDFWFQVVPVHQGLYPPFEVQVLEETAEHITYRDERGIVMRQRRDRGSIPGFIEHPVKTRDDWERLKAERLDPDHPGRYQVNWDAFNSYLVKTGAAAQVGNYPHGVFGTARDLMGAEGLLLALYDQPDLVHDIMDTMTNLWIRIFERVVERVPVGCLHMWEDMSGRQGSLISPEMVRRFMMPNYRRLKEFADSTKVPLMSVDSDGDVSQLVPIMMEAGVNFFWPFEVQAGCDVEEYRCRYPRLAIMGGLDKRALAQGREEINRELERAKRMLLQGGFVASLDHCAPPDVPWENYRYFMTRYRELAYGLGT